MRVGLLFPKAKLLLLKVYNFADVGRHRRSVDDYHINHILPLVLIHQVIKLKRRIYIESQRSDKMRKRINFWKMELFNFS